MELQPQYNTIKRYRDVPLVELLLYLVVTRMPGESYRRRLRSLLLCFVGVNPKIFMMMMMMTTVIIINQSLSWLDDDEVMMK